MLEDTTYEALKALRDVGLDAAVHDDVDARCRFALARELAKDQRRPRPRFASRSRMIVAVLASVGVIGGATAAAESLFGAATVARYVHVIATSPGHASRPGVTTIPAAMARVYSVLAKPRQAGDQPPAIALSLFDLARWGGNADLARRALTTSTGESAYVIPANGAVCLTTFPRLAGGCGPFPPVASNEMIGGTAVCSPELPSNEIAVAGLLPSDATDVTLRLTDGSTRSITATNGVFVVVLPRARPLPASVTWTSGLGVQRADTGTPSDAASGNCASPNGP